jgi:hypothetical protein
MFISSKKEAGEQTMTYVQEHPFKPILLDLLRQAGEDVETFVRNLSEAECAAVGTPDHWAAKDHMAHMTFWQERLTANLSAIRAGQAPPSSEPFLELNEQIFAERRDTPWPDVLNTFRQATARVSDEIGQLAEEDLVGLNRFAWQADQNPATPLYGQILGNTYEHFRDHLAQYRFDRGDLEGATRVVESWTDRFVATDAPEDARGTLLYNEACFYATHRQLDKARPTLEKALQLAPHLEEWSKSDIDLVGLRQVNPTDNS